MLRKIFDLHYKFLEKHPSLSFLKPLIDAGDNFFYGVSEVTEEKPHIRDGIDIKRFMITVLFAVIPAAVASVYFYGWRSILIILTSYIAGGIAEVVFCIIRKEEITEGFLITGILYPLILPPTIPLWMVAVGIIVGVILGKEVFGGTGKNPFNAALVARCFLYISFPLFMTSAAFVPPMENSLTTDGWKPVIKGTGGFLKHRGLLSHDKIDGKTEATPCNEIKSFKAFRDPKASDKEYKDFMAYVKSSIPKMFWGKRGGSIGESCSILLLFGMFLLIVTKVGNWRTIVSGIIACALLSFLLYGGRTFEDRLYLAAFGLLSGGFLFGIIFMATDPVSGPSIQTGRYFYGFAIGAITVVIRRFSGYPEGIMFSILLMNIFAALIDEIVLLVRYRGVKYEKLH